MAQIRVQFAIDQIVHANLDHFVAPYQDRGVSKAAIYAKLLMLGIQVALDLDLDLTDEVAVGRTHMETLKIDYENDSKADLIAAVRREVDRDPDRASEFRHAMDAANVEMGNRDDLPW